MPHFLIVDDHSSVREGLKHILQNEFPSSTIAFAVTPPEAIAEVDGKFTDLVILDISLTGRDGLTLTREIKDRSPRSHILIHSMHPEDQFGIRALRAGADGYLTKDRPVAELIAATRKLLQGGRWISPALAEHLANAVAHPAGGGLDSLSDRELQILRMTTAGKSPTNIAEDLGLSIKTVSTYRTRLLEKLDLRTTADLIRFGLENNLSGD